MAIGVLVNLALAVMWGAWAASVPDNGLHLVMLGFHAGMCIASCVAWWHENRA